MSLSQFTDILSLSSTQISEEIIKTEKELFDLYFKKATRQTFKSHQIKNTRRKLAQLKTLLNSQVQEQKLNEQTILDQFVTN